LAALPALLLHSTLSAQSSSVLLYLPCYCTAHCQLSPALCCSTCPAIARHTVSSVQISAALPALLLHGTLSAQSKSLLLYLPCYCTAHCQLSPSLCSNTQSSAVQQLLTDMTAADRYVFGLSVAELQYCQPVPVAARSEAWVCGRSLTGISGSNSVVGMDVCLL